MKRNNSFSKWNKLPFIPGGIGTSLGTIPPLVLPPGIVSLNPELFKVNSQTNFFEKYIPTYF